MEADFIAACRNSGGKVEFVFQDGTRDTEVHPITNRDIDKVVCDLGNNGKMTLESKEEPSDDVIVGEIKGDGIGAFSDTKANEIDVRRREFILRDTHTGWERHYSYKHI